MQNLATELNDIAITRAVLLQQLGTSMSKDVNKAYLAILDDLKARILRHEELNPQRVKQIIKEIKDITFPALPIYDDLKEFSTDEAQWLITSTNTAAGGVLFKAVPPESIILAIGSKPVMEGALIKNWFGGLNDKMKFDFERAINMSLLQGESTQEASKRVTQVMGVSLNQAETLVRTAIADVSSRVREEVFQANEDVIKGRRHVSTIDSKTSDICMVRDGAEWDNKGKGLNAKGKANTYKPMPLHPRERSYYEPILKSWQELGEDIKSELPETTRASLDGQVPSNITFDEFLSTKSKSFVEDLLGVGKAELYLSGKISLGDLVTKSGKSVSLAQLRAKYS